MKKLILIITVAVIVIACKKKSNPPAEPTQPSCETKSKKFEGRYVRVGSNELDTLSIVFIKNYCPIEGKNQYAVKNVYNCVKTMTTSAGVENRDYNTTSDETAVTLYTNSSYMDNSNTFKFSIDNGQLYMTCYYLSYSITYWKRVA